MNTLTQQYVMAVFAVKYRLGMIHPSWASDLYAMMGKILRDIDGVNPVKINGFKDHVHALYSTRGIVADAEIVRRLKTESSRWINSSRLTLGRFGWQRGCARISCSPGNISRVIQYIDSQWEHHRTTPFKDEYERMLRSFGLIPTEFDLPENLV